MRLEKLTLLNFKNLREQELLLPPQSGIVCLTGDNGAGKTNLLDAVYYLSMGRSSQPATDAQSIHHEGDFFLLDGAYRTDQGRGERIVCSFARAGGKTLKRNGKEYERLSEHVGLAPVVLSSPADAALVSDSAEERRRYLNAFISQLDGAYLRTLVRYNAVLSERNRVLKSSRDETMLGIYDQQLSEHGVLLHRRRGQIVQRLEPEVERLYGLLSGARERVRLRYRSQLDERPFEEILQVSRERDFVLQHTSAGVHRDDLLFEIGGLPLRKYGSQGQQKSFLVALKLAQHKLVAEERGERPILLLDDLFDKLDAGRVEQLIRLVDGGAFGQIFLTDCNPDRLRATLDRAGARHTILEVRNGELHAAQ